MTDESLIAAARGEIKADVLLKNARVVNVFSGEIIETGVALRGERIAGLGDYHAHRTVDLKGRYLCPGFIDAHVHLESSMVQPSEFARAVVPRGTTSVIADPHEIANVLGEAGVAYMLKASEGLPLRVLLMAPSCVPATHMETSGAVLDAAAIGRLLKHPRVLGLAEMMNFPGVIFRDPAVMKKLETAQGRPLDGHAPGLSGRDLCAYAAAGIGSDHECTTLAEAREKLRLGFHIFVREGTAARNLQALLPLVTPDTAARVSLCTDDRHPADLLTEGHIAEMVAACVRGGVPPVTAIRMASLHTAQYFGLRDLGAIAPGYRADLLVLEDLKTFRVRQVYSAGRCVAERGKLLVRATARPAPRLSNSVYLPRGEVPLATPVVGHGSEGRVQVIDIVPGQILTRAAVESLPLVKGRPQPDAGRDLLKMAVIERHHATGQAGLGFVRGFGLRRGALASTVAHDSHNLVVVGADDGSMQTAVRAIRRMKGGQVVVDGDRVLAELALPVAGLMSDAPLEEVRRALDCLSRAAKKLGCALPDPLMTLAFLALPVIPELKLTDRGLVDVTRFALVPLAADSA